MPTTVGADLEFTLDREGHPSVRGRITGQDNRLVLEVDDAAVFAGSDDASAIRAVAETLAERGLAVRVVQRGLHLVTIGAVRAPWWQRPFTGSRRVRVASARGAWTALRSRGGGAESVLPDRSLVPPPTLWPPLPTLGRLQGVSTTHDPDRGGAPRLVLLREAYQPGEGQPVWALRDGTTIGSGEGCDIRLPGLFDLHAVVRHDEDDEWVVQAVAGLTRVHGAPVEEHILRTGARLRVGEHELGFFREEYADHGRPHGGRVGGEFGRQQPQPPRPGGADRPDF